MSDILHLLQNNIDNARYSNLVGMEDQIIALDVSRQLAEKIQNSVFNTFGVTVRLSNFKHRDTTYSYYVHCTKKVTKSTLRDLQMFAKGICSQ